MSNPLNKLSNKERKKFVDNVNNIVISANHTIFQLEQLSYSPVWVKEVKKAGTLFLSKLMKVEKQFDLLASENDKVDNLYDTLHEFIEEVKTTRIQEMRRHTLVLRAFKEHEEEMLEFIKKLYNIDNGKE